MSLSLKTTAFLLIMGCTVHAQTHSWTGNAGDNNWSTSSNWDSGTVPGSTSHVFLGTGSLVEITAAASLSTLLIDPGANLIVQANLTIAEVVTIQNTGTLTWQDGSIMDGDIVNDGLILIENFEEKSLDNVSITNYREVVMQNANNIRLLNSVQIHNTPQAIFSVASNGAISSQDTTTHLFLNEGLLEKVSNSNGDPGLCYLIFDLENRGILKTDVDQNFLILATPFNFTNFEEGRIEGFGILDITSNFINLGTYDPGDEETVGTIGITNIFATSAQSTIVIDIQGPAPGQYDTYDIVGFPNLKGNLEINLDYTPQINEVFTILTAIEINECDFPSQVTSANGSVVFDVICNQTSVVLRAAEILSVEDFVSEGFELTIVPNPVEEVTRIHFSAELVFAENISLHIYNIQGQKVDTIEQLTDGYAYNRSRLASGLYFARLEANGAVLATQKLLLK